MKKELAEQICDILEELEQSRKSLINDYTGRGMGNKTTYAVAVNHLPDALYALYLLGTLNPHFESDVKALRVDEYGLGFVIY